MKVSQTAFIVMASLAYQVVSLDDGLANNSMTDEERANLDPNSEEYRKRFDNNTPSLIMFH
jgi:hypothetical protein